MGQAKKDLLVQTANLRPPPKRGDSHDTERDRRRNKRRKSSSSDRSLSRSRSRSRDRSRSRGRSRKCRYVWDKAGISYMKQHDLYESRGRPELGSVLSSIPPPDILDWML